MNWSTRPGELKIFYARLSFTAISFAVYAGKKRVAQRGAEPPFQQ
jgi:hypothetical protein